MESTIHNSTQTIPRPDTPHFQTFLAFVANNNYAELREWFNHWEWHHWDEVHWVPWETKYIMPWLYYNMRRPKPTPAMSQSTRSSLTLVQCPKCHVWLTSPWEFSLHVPKETHPVSYDRFGNRDDGSICWKMQWLYAELWWKRSEHLPRFIAVGLASVTQIRQKELEPYNPVVCAHCKVWVMDLGSAVIHKECAAICWQARHSLWRRPVLTEYPWRNQHVVGMTTLIRSLKPLVFWRHAIAQTLLHRLYLYHYMILLHDLPPSIKHPDLFLSVLAFLIAPFQRHVYLTKATLIKKRGALQSICYGIDFVRHH